MKAIAHCSVYAYRSLDVVISRAEVDHVLYGFCCCKMFVWRPRNSM